MNLDFHELNLMMKAEQQRTIDERAMIAFQAFMTNKASLRDKNGKLIYTSLNKLYDYEKELNKLDKKAYEDKAENPMLRRMREFYKTKQ